MIPFPLVLVEWKDHCSETTWVSPKDLTNQPELCLTVGWLVKEDDDGMTIVSCVDAKDPATGTMGSTQYIVKSCITGYKVLRKARLPRKKKT
jgi:hypothetical protein